MMSEKQDWLWASMSRDSGLKGSTSWPMMCFLTAQTHSFPQSFQLSWLRLKLRLAWSSGDICRNRSMALMDSHSHSFEKKYLYRSTAVRFCCNSNSCFCPSIFQETTPKRVPTLLFTCEGRRSASDCSRRPHSLSTIRIGLTFSPYSRQASTQMSSNWLRVMKLRVVVDRLRVSIRLLCGLTASTSMRLLAQSVGTTSILLEPTPQRWWMRPSPVWQMKQEKGLGWERCPSQSVIVGPREGTRSTVSCLPILKQLCSTQFMVKRQASMGSWKLSCRQVRAAWVLSKAAGMTGSSNSSSSGRQPGPLTYTLERRTTFLTSVLLRAPTMREVASRWLSTILVGLEKSTKEAAQNSTSMPPCSSAGRESRETKATLV